MSSNDYDNDGNMELREGMLDDQAGEDDYIGPTDSQNPSEKSPSGTQPRKSSKNMVSVTTKQVRAKESKPDRKRDRFLTRILGEGDEDIDEALVDYDDDSEDEDSDTSEKHSLRKSATGTHVARASTQEPKQARAQADDTYNTTEQASVRRKIYFIDIFVQIVSVLLPASFLALGILQVLKSGRSVDKMFSEIVSYVDKIAITVWPIMFVAITAQAIKCYGIYQAERGITIINLNRLMHSTSFAHAVLQPFQLRTFDWLCVLLFLCWGLSPIGSQALQRMSYLDSAGTSADIQVKYSLPGNWNGVSVLENRVNTAALFSGAIVSSHETIFSAQDSWDFPKIPIIGPLNDGSWYDVDLFSNSTSWSSLLGIPLSINDVLLNNNENSSITLNVATGYFAFHCTQFSKVAASQFNTSQYYPQSSQQTGLLLSIEKNINNSTGPPNPDSGIFHIALSDSLDESGTSLTYIQADCPFNFVPLLAEVGCTSQYLTEPFCFIDAVKPSNDEQVIKQYTLVPGDFDSQLATVLPSQPNSNNTLSASYLLDPLRILRDLDDTEIQGSNLTDRLLVLNATILSTNFGLFVNTFYQARGNATAYLAGLDTSSNTGLSTNGTLFNATLVWKISMHWTIIFFICDVFLLLLAIAAIFWEYKSTDPTVLSFSNNLIRANKPIRRRLKKMTDEKERSRFRVRLEPSRTVHKGVRMKLKPFEPQSVVKARRSV